MLNSIKKILGHIVIGFTLATGFMGFKYAYYQWMPTSWHFKYYDVLPVKDYFTTDETISFVSDREIKRTTHIQWVDILFCWENGELKRFSEYRTNGWKSKTERELTNIWNYNAETPNFSTQCYLSSEVHALLPFNIKKTQEIVGWPFNIIGK